MAEHPRDGLGEETEGHYRTVGSVLVGMGFLGVVLGLTSLALELSLPMADGNAFAVTGAAISLVGLATRLTGRSSG